MLKSYVWITFGAMALGLYELSGGSDFEPGENGLRVFAEVTTTPLDAGEVSRLALVDMTAVGPVGSDSGGSDAGRSELAGADVAVLSAIRSPEAGAEIEAATHRVAMVLPASAAPATVTAVDLRSVNGSNVNLRNGPGQGHSVLTRLSRGTTVQVLEDPGDGWVRLQVVPQGRIGWMADFLLDRS